MARQKEPLTINVFAERSPIFQLVRMGIDRSIFAAAVRATANRVARNWREMVMVSSAKEGFKRPYATSIQVEMLSELRARVTAQGKFVNFVEKGIKAFDMKRGLLAGPRARVGQDGRPFTIVAFRHGTPGSRRNPMSMGAYAEAKKIKDDERYLATGTRMRQNVRGDWVRQKIYKPGAGRVRGVSEPRTVRKGTRKEYTHKAGRYEGMVKAGSPRHTQYLTFRVVSMASAASSWWYPGVTAAPVFPKANQATPDTIKRTFKMAVIKALGGVAAQEAGG